MSRKMSCIYSGGSNPLNYVLSDLTLEFPWGCFKYVSAFICSFFFLMHCVQCSKVDLKMSFTPIKPHMDFNQEHSTLYQNVSSLFFVPKKNPKSEFPLLFHN